MNVLILINLQWAIDQFNKEEQEKIIIKSVPKIINKMKGLIQQDSFSIKNSQQHPIIQKLIDKGPTSHRNISNIKWLLTDHLSENQKRHNSHYQTKALNNPITQQNKIVKIPKLFKIHDKTQNQNNGKFQSEAWSQIKRKYSKPYSDCTKYIDNLSQHKALIRRGPFNIPLDKHNILTKNSTYEIGTVQKDRQHRQRQVRQVQRYSQNLNQIQSSRIKSISYSLYGRQQKYLRSKQNKKQIIFKSLNNLKKYEFEQNKQLSHSLHKYDKLIPPLNKFDKSIQNQLSNYKNLMKKQRYFKQENIALKNSVNKLVAIDLIKQKLNQNNLLNKNNLAKLQKKFKKRKQFVTKDQISQ